MTAYERSSLRASLSLADLRDATEDPALASTRQRSGSSAALLDVAPHPGCTSGAMHKRFPSSNIAQLAAKIGQAEAAKLRMLGNGGAPPSTFVGARGMGEHSRGLADSQCELPRVNLDDVMTRPAAATHLRVENPSRSAPLERRAFHGSASTVGAEGDGLSAHSSASSGLELTVSGFDTHAPYSDRPRSQSATALGPRSSSPGGPDVRNAILSAFHRDGESLDARSRYDGKSDSLDMLPSGETFPELWRRPRSPFDGRSASPTEHFKATTSQSAPGSFGLQAHQRSYSATNMATLVPGPPPLPPPRSNRMSTKRFSVPDILDRDGVYNPEEDQTGRSPRRMSMANITSVSSYPEQRFLPSGNSLSPFRIENHPGDRHSLSGSKGQVHLPPVPQPPPLPPQLQVTERSRSPSLRRMTLENLTLSNSLPTIQVTDQDSAPLSPASDYPDNDLSPLTKDQPARFFPQQQQADVKQNIYKAVSEASTMYSAHHAPSEETQSTNADSSLDDEEIREDTWRPYDVFQVSEREAENDGAVFREILKVLRLILYFVLITAILGGTVAARASLLLLTSGVVQDDKQKGENVVMLLLCICSPMVVNWFLAFMKILFSGKDWPSLPTFLVLLLLELLHAFGICLLVFRVLPVTDFFRGITVTMATFTLPSLFKLILLERKPKAGFWDCMKLIGAILAFLTQVAAIGFFLLTTFPAKGINSTFPSKDVQITESQQLHSLVWELPLALVLTSLGWWENYVSGEWSMCGKVKLSFQRVRKVAQDVRETVYFLVAPLKIGLIILLAKFLTGASFLLPQRPKDYRGGSATFHMTSYSLVYLELLATMLVTYLASLACKLHMQKAAFALPLMLSPPVSLAIVYLQCHFRFLPTHWHVGAWYCPAMDWQDLIMPIACAAALWMSYCLIVSHIWFPKSERMAKVEKLFTTPHFDAIFPDFNLTLRRRRNDRELRATRLERFTYVGDDAELGDAPTDDSSDVTPKVYVCATMWHETQREMTQLLKSLFRLDYVHCASRLAQEKFRIRDPDYFDLEIHLIFDDAFDLDESSDRYVPNSFVKQLIECMEDAARSVVKGPIVIPPPVKTPAPYGGRLVWTMPGQTKMYVHLKNKNLIRHRKRWSQVMYLYYLLGFRLLGGKDETHDMTTPEEEEEEEEKVSNVRHRKDKAKSKNKGFSKRRKRAAMPLRSLLGHMPPEKYEKTIQMSENTFIMTLDGDVDFQPDSVKLLLDRMKKNKKVGAVCGRIHPIGSGPMVWYQQFEYAVGHWLQKASEHVFGCVLCCPGCFSLFRGSALMDDNVVKRYTTKPTEAAHFIQFEQGEDRWLCTLLLQQGHRIDYSAGADALTFAPETFNEFFNQRRRWSPSTLANMMDLLSSWHETVRMNDNISRLYIFYQFLLMASSILAPSTVVLMITGSYHSVLGFNIWWAFLMSLLPVAFYLGVCLTQTNDMQIKIGAVLTAFYAVVMMIATVGTLISIATESFNSPNVVFLSGLGIIFTVAAILHPQEFFCLVYGALYFLVVPSTFILLTIFYLCNLNNVSWGTREVPKKQSPEEIEAQKKAEEEKAKNKKKMFTLYGVVGLIHELRDAIRGLWGLRNELHQTAKTSPQQQDPDVEKGLMPTPPAPQPPPPPARAHPPGHEPFPDNPHWLTLDYLGYGMVSKLDDDEIEFWKFLIKKYLHPLEEDKHQKAKIAEDLIIIRNNVVFIYVMMNFLWCVIALQLQSMEDTLKTFYIVQKYEPLSLFFLSIFAMVLVLQFVSMLVHRWGTFLHLMSSTRIDWCKKTHTEEEFARFVVSETQKLQNLEPIPDYEGGEDDDFDEDGMSLSDFDTSLHHHPNSEGKAAERNNGRGGIYETIGRRTIGRRSGNAHGAASQHPLGINRMISTTGEFPMLQTIFEQNLENLQHWWKQKGTPAVEQGRPPTRWDQRRPWGDRRGEMRQRFFNQNFQMPMHNNDRLFAV